MFRRKTPGNKSIKYSWIATYGILFLFPVIVSVVMFFIVDGTIKKEVNRSNYFLLKQIQQYMDTLVNDIERLAIDLAFNDRVQQIRGSEGELTLDERVKVLDLHRDIRNRVYNSAIQEVYIYFKKIQTVVNNKNVMDSTDYFNMFAENYKIDNNEWIYLNNKQYYGSYINLAGSNNSGPSNGFLVYMLSVPVNTSVDGNANIVIVVDKSKFLSMAKDIEALGKGKVAILNSDNEIILKSGDQEILSKLKYEELYDSSGVEYDDIKSKRVAVSHIDSRTKPWKYLYTMPVNEYWGKLEQYRKLIYIGMFFCITLGGVVSVILFKRNYEPLKQLVISLQDNNSKEPEMSLNEYSIIKNVITKSIDERKEVDRWISFQKEVLRCRHIENLLKGRPVDNSNNSNNLLDMSFKGDYFSVVAFRMEELSAINEENSAANMEAIKLLQFVIQNMLEELVRETGTVYTVDIDNSIVCLLNLEKENSGFKEYSRELANKIQELVKVHYKVNLVIAVSKVYKGTALVKQAYKETLELIELNEVVGGEGVLVYDDLANLSNQQYFYPIESEQVLINAVKAGEFEKVKKVIEEIFNKNFGDQVLNYSLARCLKFNLIGTLINAVNDVGNIYGDEYLRDIIVIEKIVQYKNINKIKESLLEVLKNICDRINTDRKIGVQIGDRVIEFIEKNYKDENLNISVIAEEFNMHPSYLSKLFKNQTGEGILDYINKIRIEEAKKLLKENKGNMESIAKLVGYSSTKTFTRAFTKLEGITPGKFKEI